MKYMKGQNLVSNYIMESYEVIDFDHISGKYSLNIYGENGKPDDFIGKIEIMEKDLDQHYTVV